VQGGEDKSFSDFNEAVAFIRERLAKLTKEAAKEHPKEEQESILKKSLGMWKTMAKEGPKVFMETIKDPRKSVDHLKEQLTEFGGEMMEKVPIDDWRSASKSDIGDIHSAIRKLSSQVQKLATKVDTLQAPSEGIKTTTSKPRTTATASVKKTTTVKATAKPSAKKTTKKPAAKTTKTSPKK
jgi:outer membrane murein-binding lipoprotein Lpp